MRYGELAVGELGLTYSNSVPAYINGRRFNLGEWERAKRLGELQGKWVVCLYDERARALCLDFALLPDSAEAGGLGKVKVNSACLEPGGELAAEVSAPPGQRVLFEVLGLGRALASSEVSSGCYRLHWRAPDIAISGVPLIARYQSGGREFTRWGPRLSIAAGAPQIYQWGPGIDADVDADADDNIGIDAGGNSGGEVFSPSVPIFVAFRSGGAPIEPGGVTLWVDGRQVAPQRTAEALTYAPAGGWAPGEHRVKVAVSDRSGKTCSRSWKFSVRQAD